MAKIYERSLFRIMAQGIQYNTILYLTTQDPGVIRNSFKHVRETKSIENKRNNLKLPL